MGEANPRITHEIEIYLAQLKSVIPEGGRLFHFDELILEMNSTAHESNKSIHTSLFEYTHEVTIQTT